MAVQDLLCFEIDFKVKYAALSPNGQIYVAIGSRKGTNSTYLGKLWHSANNWSKPFELKLSLDSPIEYGPPVFSPQSDRLAIPVAALKKFESKEKTVCLEWSLESLSALARKAEKEELERRIEYKGHHALEGAYRALAAYGLLDGGWMGGAAYIVRYNGARRREPKYLAV